MIKILKPSALALAALLLAACGGSSSPTATVSAATTPGTLSVNPPFRIASLDAAALQAALSATATGAQLLQLTGNPVCGVDFYYLKFMTLGGAGEMTQSSGALMVPTGAAGCSGPRPIVEYAHAPATNQAANIANITDPTNIEGLLIAAMFAAQGYIVVAPNYAGYDISTLGYHPFLDAEQQSGEMMDILAAARTALPNTFTPTTSDNGQLFLTGYSEGGHVAMATLRGFEAAGDSVTAAAPMSGPYALEAFGDTVFGGGVNLGSTVFGPLLANSYQHAYMNINNGPEGPIFSSTYPNAETQLPSTIPIDTIFAESLLPQTALFDSATPTQAEYPMVPPPLIAAMAVPPIDPNIPVTEIWHAGFGNPYLINNNYRVSYVLDAAQNPDGAVPAPQPGVPLAKVKPTQGLRQDFYVNDLRNGNWAPTVPTLMCGGSLDPTVYFSVNTGTMAAFWQPLVVAGVITVLDVDPQPPAVPAGPFIEIQQDFQAYQAAQFAYYQTAAGGGLSAAAAQQMIVEGYHVSVLPFCSRAARSFFSHF